MRWVAVAQLGGIEETGVESMRGDGGERAGDHLRRWRTDHQLTGHRQKPFARDSFQLAPQREGLLQQWHVPRTLEIGGPRDPRLAMRRAERVGRGVAGDTR